MQKHVASILAIGLTLALGGCAGEGDSNPAPTPSPTPPAAAADSPEGLWPGSTDTHRTIISAVLDDNSYYVLYSAPAPSTVIAGFVYGTGISNNGTFKSTNAKDFNLEGLGVLDATIDGNYAPRDFLKGTVNYSGVMVPNFTTKFDPAYDTTPSLASLAGIYTGPLGSALGNPGGPLPSVTVTVTTTGTFAGVDASGCHFSGTITARVRGNIFNGSIIFTDPPPCLFSGIPLNGIVYLDVAAPPNGRLYIAAPISSPPTDGVIFSGTR